MNLDARQFAGRTRDSEWERNLARDLRSIPEADRLVFIEDLLRVHEAVALDLARRCLSRPKSFERILELGLQMANASSIQDWLRCVLHALGTHRLVRCLDRHKREYPKSFERAYYWIPGMIEAITSNPRETPECATFRSN